jgi:hypothetical protein
MSSLHARWSRVQPRSGATAHGGSWRGGHVPDAVRLLRLEQQRHWGGPDKGAGAGVDDAEFDHVDAVASPDAHQARTCS